MDEIRKKTKGNKTRQNKARTSSAEGLGVVRVSRGDPVGEVKR